MRPLSCLLFFACYATLAYTQAGTLDPGFGNRGIVKSNLAFAGEAAAGRKTFMQPDGKLLMVVQEGSRTALVRFLDNGNFDPTYFDGDYRSTTDVAYGDAAQDSDGRIVIAGTRNQHFALTRYDTLGFIDLDIGIPFASAAVATAVAVQKDGKIVVAGYSYVDGVARFAVARCTADGVPDSSFSSDGNQLTSNGNNGAYATAIAIQPDGKIVVGGYAGGYGARCDFALIRYNTNGSRDLTFSDDGKQLTTVGVYDDIANTLAIQKDGKIVLAGRTQLSDGPSGKYAIATVRYLPNGSLDATFSEDGMAISAIGTSAEATAILVQQDAKIVVAGTTGTATAADFALLRYNSNGSLDAAFGTGGKQVIDFSNGADQVSAALLTDEKILLTGWTDPAGHQLREIALARYTATGQPDVSFGNNGKTSQYFSSGGTTFNSIRVQKDGKLLAVGSAAGDDLYRTRMALARYNPDGSFDTSFGIGGKATTQLEMFGAGGNTFVLQSDGKIIVAGDLYTGESNTTDFVLVRYTATGQIDSTFGNNGIVYIDFTDEIGSSSYDTPYSITIQPDGKIVVVGEAGDSGGQLMAVARCNTDGSLDSSFGGNGKRAFLFSDVYYTVRGTAVVLQRDDKILVGGNTMSSVTLQNLFALVRLNKDGTFDNTFSSYGKLTTSFGNFDKPAGINALVIQPDGKIIAAGGSNGNFTLVRYFPNGNLDLSFSGDGKQTSNFGGMDGIYTIQVQEDGKLLAAGVSNEKLALARYNSNGTPDSTFGLNGKEATAVEAGPVELRGMVISGNHVYAAGSSGEVGLVVAYRMYENPLLTKAAKAVGIIAATRKLVVNAFPNPTTQSFILQISSNSDALINVRVTDAAGRIMDVMQNLTATGSLQFGANYSTGVYYAEVQQGTETKILKLVKEH